MEKYVSCLVQGDIDRLRHFVCDLIAEFYKEYDPRVSMDQSFITNLISFVHFGVDELMSDLDHVKKDKKK